MVVTTAGGAGAGAGAAGGGAGEAAAGVAAEGGWEDVATKQESGRRCGRAHTGGERGHTLMKMLDVDEDAERSYFDCFKDVPL